MICEVSIPVESPPPPTHWKVTIVGKIYIILS